jgi:two-component system, sensor histidine kinase and response regulator
MTSPDPQLPKPPQARILIIDDDDSLRELMKIVLETAGFFVLQARDGTAGLSMAINDLPDLIVCDVHLPGHINGFRIAQEVRANPTTTLTPLIFLTGESREVARRYGMSLGADDYLMKPFNSEDLITAIETRLTKSRIVEVEKHRLAEVLRSSLSMSLPHEFRTPLNGILGFTELLRHQKTRAHMAEAEIEEMLGYIDQSGRRLQHLVERFLLYFQLYHLKSVAEQPASPPFNLSHLLKELVRFVGEQNHREKDFSTEISPIELALPEEEMRVLFRELMDNACKFSSVGAPIVVQSETIGDHYVVTITDLGSGMTAEQIRQIAPFCQFNRDEKAQEGLGLGLSLVKKLLEKNHGSFHIKSDPESGTAIAVHLPIKIVTKRV